MKAPTSCCAEWVLGEKNVQEGISGRQRRSFKESHAKDYSDRSRVGTHNSLLLPSLIFILLLAIPLNERRGKTGDARLFLFDLRSKN